MTYSYDFSRSKILLQAAVAACALLVPMAALPHSAAAQDDTIVRLNRLEGEMDTLSRAVFKGESPVNLTTSASPSADYQANVEVRLSELEKQMRDMTGKVEQQSYDLAQIKEQLAKAAAVQQQAQIGTPAPQMGMTAPATPDMSHDNSAPVALGSNATPTQSGTLKPDDLGGEIMPLSDPNAPAPANAPSAGTLGSISEAPGGAIIPPKVGDDPAGQYEMAFSLLKSGNAAAARNGFDEFLKTYPNHPLAANATYWMGESYYAQNDFAKAARIFAECYKKYPKGPKVADSLLKLGMSLGSSGKTKEACVALKQLKKEFPSGEGVTLRRADQEITRLGCDG